MKCRILFLAGFIPSLGASVYLKHYFLCFGEQTAVLLLVHTKAGECFCGDLNGGWKHSESIMSGMDGVKVVQLFSLTRLDVYRLVSMTATNKRRLIFAHLNKKPCQKTCFVLSVWLLGMSRVVYQGAKIQIKSHWYLKQCAQSSLCLQTSCL